MSQTDPLSGTYQPAAWDQPWWVADTITKNMLSEVVIDLEGSIRESGEPACAYSWSKQEPDSLGGTEEHQKWGNGLIGGGGAHES